MGSDNRVRAAQANLGGQPNSGGPGEPGRPAQPGRPRRTRARNALGGGAKSRATIEFGRPRPIRMPIACHPYEVTVRPTQGGWLWGSDGSPGWGSGRTVPTRSLGLQRCHRLHTIRDGGLWPAGSGQRQRLPQLNSGGGSVPSDLLPTEPDHLDPMCSQPHILPSITLKSG